jgi:hypothetical protein
MKKCQTNIYTFLNYKSKVCNLLPRYMLGYIAAKFYLKTDYRGYHCKAIEEIFL